MNKPPEFLDEIRDLLESNGYCFENREESRGMVADQYQGPVRDRVSVIWARSEAQVENG